MSEKQQEKGQRKRGDRWLIVLVSLLFLVGLGIRGYGYMTRTGTGTIDGRQDLNTLREGGGRTIRPNTDEPAEGVNWVTKLAPYLTEGGLSFFLGFCIGYFLRVVAKIVILLVGAVYVGLILLSHYGLITIDWGSFQHVLQQLLLNTKTQVEGFQGMLTVGLPSVTVGCLGIWRGLK